MSGCIWCALTGYCPSNIKQILYEKLGRRWNTKYKKFLAGQDASTIQDTVIESKPSEPTRRYYKRINVDELKNTKTSHELHTQAMDDFSKAIDNDSKEISDDGIVHEDGDQCVRTEYYKESEIEQIKDKLDSALKLQELVKAQILYEAELNKPFNDYERTALYLLETLVEESEK